MPIAIASASRLRIAAWDGRGYWLTDLDSSRKLRLDEEGTVVETSEPFPTELDDTDAARLPKLPARVPDGWTARWGDRWAVLVLDKLFVGRGGALENVVHLESASDQIRAYRPGIVVHLRGRDHAFPWDAFDRAEIHATPIVIELAPSVRRPVRVLIATPTLLRVEILEPEPTWRRTLTIAAHGNPLGFAPGETALAVGNEVEGQFVIAHVLREEPTSATTATRGAPELVARSKVSRPAWAAGLVRVGLVDAIDDVPEHMWTATPVAALAAIYEPREALDRGFVWYSVKIGNSTSNPVHDFERMAQAPNGALKGIRAKRDDDFDGFDALLTKVNARLAELGVPRRIYELATDGAWYALIARTPSELPDTEAVGLKVL